MKKILIADDDVISLEVLKAMLCIYPVTVVAVSNGANALAQARTLLPDLCIFDYSMEDMTGADVCQLMRSEAAFAHTPIIALTGHQNHAEHARCRDAGMNEILIKPIAPEALAAVLRTYQILL